MLGENECEAELGGQYVRRRVGDVVFSMDVLFHSRVGVMTVLIREIKWAKGCAPDFVRTSSSIFGAIFKVKATIAAQRSMINSPTILIKRVIKRFFRSAAATSRCCFSSKRLDGVRSVIEPTAEFVFVVECALDGAFNGRGDAFVGACRRKVTWASAVAFVRNCSGTLLASRGWDCSSRADVFLTDIQQRKKTRTNSIEQQWQTSTKKLGWVNEQSVWKHSIHSIRPFEHEVKRDREDVIWLTTNRRHQLQLTEKCDGRCSGWKDRASRSLLTRSHRWRLTCSFLNCVRTRRRQWWLSADVCIIQTGNKTPTHARIERERENGEKATTTFFSLSLSLMMIFFFFFSFDFPLSGNFSPSSFSSHVFIKCSYPLLLV